MKQRRGGKKALIALARKILTIIYTILKKPGEMYREDFYEATEASLLQRRQQKMITELRASGYTVSPITG